MKALEQWWARVLPYVFFFQVQLSILDFLASQLNASRDWIGYAPIETVAMGIRLYARLMQTPHATLACLFCALGLGRSHF